MLNELIEMGLPNNPIDQNIYHELIQLYVYYADFTGFLLTLYKMKAENEIIMNESKILINENTIESIIEPILLNKLA